jgi:hypothetical protein
MTQTHMWLRLVFKFITRQACILRTVYILYICVSKLIKKGPCHSSGGYSPASRVRSQVRSCGICGGRSVSGADFLRVLRFPLPILIPPTAPHSSSSVIWCRYTRPNSGRRTNRLNLTPPLKIETNIKNVNLLPNSQGQNIVIEWLVFLHIQVPCSDLGPEKACRVLVPQRNVAAWEYAAAIYLHALSFQFIIYRSIVWRYIVYGKRR